MSSSFSSIQIHFIFGTKFRERSIDRSWSARLHEYLGGTARGLGCSPLAIGGVEDHVHALLALRPTHAAADVMREVKKAGNSFVRTEIGLRYFAWQEGYGAIAVSPTSIEGVTKYIQNQEQHHQQKTFDQELGEIFKAAGIPFVSGVDMR